MTKQQIEFIKLYGADLYERVKAYENVLVPYSLRVDLLMFLKECSKLEELYNARQTDVR